MGSHISKNNMSAMLLWLYFGSAPSSAWITPYPETAKTVSKTVPQFVESQHPTYPNNVFTTTCTVSRACQSAAISLFAGCAILSSPVQASNAVALPPPSPRVEVLEAATTKKETANENKIQSLTIPQQQDEASVLEEVWTLVDKYYIDRSFGSQDWDKVHSKYTYLYGKAKGDDSKFKVLTEMVGSLHDKYTRLLDQTQYTAIQKYDLIGVGVTLMPDENQKIKVGAPPIAGSEAAKTGMEVGDFVTAINGIPTDGRTAFDIIDQISEQPNAKQVSMTVQRGGDKEREFVMTRNVQEVTNPIRYKVSERRSDGTVVGYVKISEFNSLVKGSLEKALADLEKAGVNAYVLDVRQNTGGAFQSAVEISSLFVDDRVATYVVDNSAAKMPFRTAKGKLAIDKSDPVAMWIDGRSASASEVLAGSLHDNCRAVLMGDKSFGKGLIQAVYGLKNGSGLVMTVAGYVTPSGTNIQGVGITPDLGNEYLPFGPLGLGTDTSKVNFADISSRLSEKSCRIPEEMK